MYFGPIYYKDNYAMEKFKGVLSFKKFETLMKNIHTALCSPLVQDNDKDFDFPKTHDLSNHTKVPVKKRNVTIISQVDHFHGRYSVLSVLLTPLKLKIYNCSHQHHCESMMYNGSIMDIIIPVKYFIVIVHLFIVELHNGMLKMDFTIQIQDYSFQ